MFSFVPIQTDMAVHCPYHTGIQSKVTAPCTTLTQADSLMDKVLYPKGNSPQYPQNRWLVGVAVVCVWGDGGGTASPDILKDVLHPPEIKLHIPQPTG
jgi:hypothetical protein